MSRLKLIALQVAGMIAAAQSNDFYNTNENRTGGMVFNPDYKAASPARELREFTIKGKKVLAHSKKDAIKRLKHSK